MTQDDHGGGRPRKTYEDGVRDERLDKLEKEADELWPRLTRMERIVYGALSIFGMISYWPAIQRFMVSIGV